jgi:hypothetical protein
VSGALPALAQVRGVHGPESAVTSGSQTLGGNMRLLSLDPGLPGTDRGC